MLISPIIFGLIKRKMTEIFTNDYINFEVMLVKKLYTCSFSKKRPMEYIQK